MRNARKHLKEPSGPVVFIVDDDLSMRESLIDLFRSMKIEAEAFENATSFLAMANFNRPGCILLDVRLPGVNGLDFQPQLARIGSKMPIIFMTGFGDIPMSVRAMKAGAVDFLTKPFRDQDILDAVGAAMERDAARRRHSAQNEAVASLAENLTPREREVMDAVVKGMMNKQIAYELGISEVTVKLHRGNVMRKMKARSVAELVRKAEMLGQSVPPPVSSYDIFQSGMSA
ncbi:MULTISPECIES: response regulator transcription factor [unclassified Sinorhizobium]|uniref:response regulator transcription factor n=1 Tax=unclassified Sinorhizobium TaxID=2613772 RepID=UPI003523DBBE